ncbi:MAG: class I SAM-dependent methyltransferase [Acidimicrobiia bacterium]
MSVHEVAVTGFGTEAEAYERGRPSYPPDAVAWLADSLRIAPGRTVADVAAGTGKFTRLLAPYGADVVGVEPVDGMRAFLGATAPGVRVVAGAAEALPFADGSLDAITVAQAFHWFDALAALREFHRVLRPAGRVGLIWNARNRSVPWVDAMWTIMDRVEKRAPWRNHDEWRESAFVDQPFFTPLTEAVFRHEQLLTHDEAIDRMRSVSHIAVLPPAEQEVVLEEVRAVLDRDPATAGQDVIALPYRVDTYWTVRR